MTHDEMLELLLSLAGDEFASSVRIGHGGPGFPSASQSPPASGMASHGHGPGTELKKLLAGWPLYIKSKTNCSCNARARKMDDEEAKEPGWCEAHLDQIVGWLREEATKRGLPFLDMAGRVLVRRAIKNAQRAKASA